MLLTYLIHDNKGVDGAAALAVEYKQALKSYLGPRSSAGHSLRFRDSALAGSDGFSPTPLILNAYQRLEKQEKTVLHMRHCIPRNSVNTTDTGVCEHANADICIKHTHALTLNLCARGTG